MSDPAKLKPRLVRMAARQRETSAALAAPMTNIPLAGDPRLTDEVGVLSLDPQVREICLYVAAMLIKRGMLPVDASGFDARLHAPATVVITRADACQAEVCRFDLAEVLG